MFAMRDGVADVGLQSRHAISAHDEPNLQRTKAATERDLPVTVVGDETGVGVGVAKV